MVEHVFSKLGGVKQVPFTEKYHVSVGDKFGRLTVEAILREKRKTHRGSINLYDCKCECGGRTKSIARDLVTGRSSSCGCVRRERTLASNSIHGLSKHPLYRVWKGMKTRCYNSNAPAYINYGGRGIIMCSEWLNDFEQFYVDSLACGYAEGLHIDRIDNDGPYAPLNCRWVTPSANNRNRRANRNIVINGVELCLEDWAIVIGITADSMAYRLRNWAAEEWLLPKGARGHVFYK